MFQTLARLAVALLMVLALTLSASVTASISPAGAAADRTISGTVYLGDNSLTAAEGEVVVHFGIYTQASNEIDYVTTDASGHYSISGLDSTHLYTLYFEYVGDGDFSGIYQDGSPLGSMGAGAVPFANGPVVVDKVLPLNRDFIGTVSLGSTAHPAPGNVTVYYEQFSVRPLGGSFQGGNYLAAKSVAVRSDGSFTLPLLEAGQYRLRFHYTGNDGFQDRWWTSGAWSSNATPLLISAGPSNTLGYFGSSTLPDMILPATALLSGTVFLGSSPSLATAGAGEVEVSWTFQNPDTGQAESGTPVFTDVNGRYEFPSMRQANYVLSFRYLPDESFFDELAISVEMGLSPFVRTVRLKNSVSASGHVDLGAGGVKAGLGEVEITFTSLTIGGRNVTVTTDSNGDYLATGLMPGSYAVDFHHVNDEYLDFQHPGDGCNVYGCYLSILQDVEGIDATLEVGGRITVTVASTALGSSDFEDHVTAYLLNFDFEIDDWVVFDARTVEGSSPSVAFDKLSLGYYEVIVEYDGPKGYAFTESPVYYVEPGTVDIFNARLTFAAGQDYSGDGLGDVLARDSSGGLWMYRGNGASGWAGGSKIGTGWNGFNLVFDAGDFDSDGFNDVIGRTPNGDLYLYRGNGAGGWLGGSKIGSGWSGFNAIFGVGDFSGDGNADVMTRTPSGDLYLYAGNGAGGWAGASKIGSGWNGFDLVFGVGDFSGDGNPDVMARTPAGALYLYRGNGVGGWASSAKIGSGWNGFNAVFGVGDFSGDGQADVMTKTPSGDLYLYRGDGNSGWAGSAKVGSGWGPLSIVQ